MIIGVHMNNINYDCRSVKTRNRYYALSQISGKIVFAKLNIIFDKKCRYNKINLPHMSHTEKLIQVLHSSSIIR